MLLCLRFRRRMDGQLQTHPHAVPQSSVGPFCFLHPSRAYVLPCPHLLQAVFQMQSVKCLKCQEENRVVLPCQHAVLCETCAKEGECPICHPNRPHALQS